jgi:hypothetical protein
VKVKSLEKVALNLNNGGTITGFKSIVIKAWGLVDMNNNVLDTSQGKLRYF